ncbi:hypothetical protein ACKYVA_19510 [Paenibacillus larvae]|uniref:hypothetical protein n=1 Tax=Paenibacillus larvae TaxID=1464 RepID=UPI003907F013
MKNQIHVEVSRSTELDRWIAERHYLLITGLFWALVNRVGGVTGPEGKTEIRQ